MIILSECSEEILDRINELNNIIPSFMDNDNEEDDFLGNPFIRYVKGKGYISNSLLEFLEHSEFLQNLTEEMLEYSIRLFDVSADIEWYAFFQNLFDQEGDRCEEFYKLVYRCFSNGVDFDNTFKVYDEWNHEDINSLKELYDALIESHKAADVSENLAYDEDPVKNIIEEKEKDVIKQADELLAASYKELFDQQKDYIDRLRADYKELESRCEAIEIEKTRLSEQLSEIFNNLENSYAIGQESKRESLKLKSEVQHLRKSLESKDKFIKRNNDKNAEYIARIQELENTNDFDKSRLEELEVMISELKGALSDKDKQVDSLMLQLRAVVMQPNNESVLSSENDVIGDSEDSFVDDEEKTDAGTNELVTDEVEDFVFEPIVEEIEEEVESDEPLNIVFDYADIKSLETHMDNVRKKNNWFSRVLFNFSKHSFIKQSREEQEGMIFIKMMEKQFPMERARFVRQALTKYGENVQCFELYKLICNNPSDDEIASFFAEYSTDSSFVSA